MGFQLSPGVQVKEIDLSTSIPAVATSLGATVGRFTWGPAFERYLITSEADLVSVFGSPTNDTFPAFFSAGAFLKFGNSLQVVRVVDSGATNATVSGSAAVKIDNAEDFETQLMSGGLTEGFYARYPGLYGNNITVSTSIASGHHWDHWQYNGAFDVEPSLSNDEIAVAVLVDGEVAEAFFVSTTEFNTDTYGNNIYANEVINKRSKLIWVNAEELAKETIESAMVPHCSDWSDVVEAVCTAGGNVWETDVTQASKDFAMTGGLAVSELVEASCDDAVSTSEAACLGAGATWSPEVSAGTVGANEYMQGWDLFKGADEVDVNLLIAGGVQNENSSQVSLVEKYMIEEISELRKDCVAFVGPPKGEVVNVGGASNAVTNLLAWRKGVSFNVNSSYGFIDGNFKQTYDKYNDTYRWVGMSGDCAGLAANTDNVRDAWWSIAGLNRGQIKGVVKLAYQPKLAHRDQLYMLPNGINPIVSFPGQGTVLWGDRTSTTKPSAFDRINVRRLFILMEKAISISAKYFLFEFNNKYTRANFRNMVNPYLAGLQAKQAMYDFYVQCDDTNNTGEVIDANEFVASIFIKPSKSINFITLNFVATKTGVDFSEVIGQV